MTNAQANDGLGAEPVDCFALKSDLALNRVDQPGDTAQGGGLAGAVGAQQGHDLRGLHRQGDAMQREDLV
jgi:hypothetical protein